jgi:uncharacterized membrane protein HdeD (DUF308 family)
MDNTGIVVMLAGALMIVGGALQLPSIIRRRRRAPWRGATVSATALVVYGMLALSGVILNGTVLSALLVWCIVAGMWCGWWLTRRDTAKQVH